MSTGFQKNYAGLSDQELLSIAEDRANLADEAGRAIDAEMGRRGLYYRQSKAETQAQRRPLWAIPIWVVGTALYIFLVPAKFKFAPEWNEPAAATFLGVTYAVLLFRGLWTQFSFWLALTCSSAVQVCVCHWLLLSYPPQTRGAGKLIWIGSLAAGSLVGAVLYYSCRYIGSQGKENQH